MARAKFLPPVRAGLDGADALVTVGDVALTVRRMVRLGWAQTMLTELVLITDGEASQILAGHREVSYNRLVWVPDRLGLVPAWLALTLVHDPGDLSAGPVTSRG